ncbi:prepilin-type N-terminal cleavage/methylation domain-containing protein [Caldimonas thermodepolymerans]|jgi:prepilin-type N-terminal cleavage/methylation domain|uniref:General secretion pathway protein GspJ n=1 Tax=Caldimonas thermodepolymerans TaxID=215580 RepID=A0A2S5T686_9BURK|nr:prepilin-type N-terminal cleavage/methylation domain-containing protein [Caldimonas thermodepolymerans]PPE70449.1 general secretion pathway protein GspJ [Caldimonas thermodepolymerans]QPC31116.1 prepilin-type N-terminal cleavage/methylation domain-containing protein [Caldimonas thermodepolymerans]RDH96570.1 general secretion pathway protein J [Caldimonas thermodepolymerans]TCP04831.1 general secretion pathway protein J [Caldimonas thermodepolymerans]UZG43843.1 prepilin-type N-terminal cleav
MGARRLSRGFTLIEVLVTITILAVLAGMAWQGIDAIVRSKAVSEERLDAVLRLNTVLAQWDADLSTLHDTGLIAEMPAFDGASLRLTRRTDAGVQLVVWSLRDGTWQRWASQPVVRQGDLLELWLRSYQLLGNEVGTVRALPGVQEWQVYYWRNNAWSNPQSTGDVQEAAGPRPGPRSAGSKVRLPEGIRIVLTMAPGSGLNGTYTRDLVLRTRSE